MMKPMRRHAKSILLLLVLGAVTTIIIAELCAMALQMLPAHRVAEGYRATSTDPCAWYIEEYRRARVHQFRGEAVGFFPIAANSRITHIGIIGLERRSQSETTLQCPRWPVSRVRSAEA